MHIVVVPILGIILLIPLQCIKANLSLDFKVTKISASPANCNVANTTYAHGETFKLDCKTQCVCENGRHACSSLCPKEQLPAPEDTISCRSPRLVEVPGHCCKMWLCENPTADVYATCHNSSSSPWTPCSQPCGLGISTRFTSTTAGCNQLINLRLCQNRKCEASTDLDNKDSNDALSNNISRDDELPEMTGNYHSAKGKVKHHKKYDGVHFHQHQQHHKHRIKKGHECRHIERLGPARIRLGQCVSRKLYRPKVCGHCNHKNKCCVPSVSTTIQVELLCPLNAADPISLLQKQQPHEGHQQRQTFEPSRHHHPEIYGASSLTSLWDTHSLDGIDQEYFQSHQIHIENKFIAIEWILKCECSENENCQRSDSVDVGSHPHRDNNNNNHISKHSADVDADTDANVDVDVGADVDVDVDVNVDDDVDDNSNNGNFNNINMHNDNSNNNNNNMMQNEKNSNNNDDYNYFGLYGRINKNNYKRQHSQHIDDNTTYGLNGGGRDDNDDDAAINKANGHNKPTTMHHNGRAVKNGEQTDPWPTSALSSPSSVSANSDEIQPDIIPYPPPPFTANMHTNNVGNQKHSGNGNSNSNGNINKYTNNGGRQQKQQHMTPTTENVNDKYLSEREQQKEQQQQYFYEQWLLQQRQQERQQSFYEQLLGT